MFVNNETLQKPLLYCISYSLDLFTKDKQTVKHSIMKNQDKSSELSASDGGRISHSTSRMNSFVETKNYTFSANLSDSSPSRSRKTVAPDPGLNPG